MTIRDAYLAAARSALDLLGRPEIARSWDEPSALDRMTVGALAGHLASQVVNVPGVLAREVTDEPTVSLLGHYEQVSWIGADLDSETNATIRQMSEDLAGTGVDDLVRRTSAAIDELARDLPTQPVDRLVRPPSGPWALVLDDFLVTRLMEIAVHSDDLAVSVGVDAPELREDVLAPVFALLALLAVQRHGQAGVLRAFARAERAPQRINAL